MPRRVDGRVGRRKRNSADSIGEDLAQDSFVSFAGQQAPPQRRNDVFPLIYCQLIIFRLADSMARPIRPKFFPRNTDLRFLRILTDNASTLTRRITKCFINSPPPF